MCVKPLKVASKSVKISWYIVNRLQIKENFGKSNLQENFDTERIVFNIIYYHMYVKTDTFHNYLKDIARLVVTNL